MPDAINLDELEVDLGEEEDSSPQDDLDIPDPNAEALDEEEVPDPEGEDLEEELPEVSGNPPKEEEEAKEEGEEGEEEDFIRDILVNQFGYDDVEYEIVEEDDTATFRNMARAAATRMAMDHIENVVGSNTESKNLFDYLKNGGDITQYVKTMVPDTDYTTMQISDEDTVQHKNLVTAKLRAEGESEEAITQALDQYEAGGILKAEAGRALGSLRRSQASEMEGVIEAQRTAAEQAQKETQKFWDDRKATISNATQLAGLPLPEKDKADFYKFISEATDDGTSAYQKKAESLTPEQQMAIQLLVYRGVDLTSFVTTKAKTSAALSLQEKLRNSKPTGNGKPRKRNESPESVDLTNADFDLNIE